MTKWEYCRLRWSEVVTSAEEAQALELDDEEARITVQRDDAVIFTGYLWFPGSSDDKRPVTKLGDTLSELGKDGWELISHIYAPSKPLSPEIFYFKRPMEQ